MRLRRIFNVLFVSVMAAYWLALLTWFFWVDWVETWPAWLATVIVPLGVLVLTIAGACIANAHSSPYHENEEVDQRIRVNEWIGLPILFVAVVPAYALIGHLHLNSDDADEAGRIAATLVVVIAARYVPKMTIGDFTFGRLGK